MNTAFSRTNLIKAAKNLESNIAVLRQITEDEAIRYSLTTAFGQSDFIKELTYDTVEYCICENDGMVLVRVPNVTIAVHNSPSDTGSEAIGVVFFAVSDGKILQQR